MSRKMSKKMLDEKVCMLKDLESLYSDIGDQIESLKDEIKNEMTRQGKEEIDGTTWRVSWKSYEISRFDQKSFRESNPDLYESFQVVSTQRRFTVK